MSALSEVFQMASLKFSSLGNNTDFKFGLVKARLNWLARSRARFCIEPRPDRESPAHRSCAHLWNALHVLLALRVQALILVWVRSEWSVDGMHLIALLWLRIGRCVTQFASLVL